MEKLDLVAFFMTNRIIEHIIALEEHLECWNGANEDRISVKKWTNLKALWTKRRKKISG